MVKTACYRQMAWSHVFLYLTVLLFADSNLTKKILPNEVCGELCAGFSGNDCFAESRGQCYISGGSCILDACAGYVSGLTIDDIFGLGSNVLDLGSGMNYGTDPCCGWPYEFNGIYSTAYGIGNSDGTEYVTTGTNKRVLVVVPSECIIEVWDLETMRVISTNYGSPGKALIFTALPNHHYGGFAWYSTNAQTDLSILAYDAERVSSFPAEYLDEENIDADSNLVSPDYCSGYGLEIDDVPIACSPGCSSGSVTLSYGDETENLYYCHASSNDFNFCSFYKEGDIKCMSTSSHSYLIKTATLYLLLTAIWIVLA